MVLGHAATVDHRPRGHYDLRAANESEREGVFQLASAHPGTILFADAGHRDREHHDSFRLVGVTLIVPDKHKPGQRPPIEVAKARTRLVIESDHHADDARTVVRAVEKAASLG